MKILDLFKKHKPSGAVAKDRLQLVLIHDRLNCDHEILERIKADIIKVISNYVDIDMEEYSIEIGDIEIGTGISPVLNANIPIKNIKK